MTTKKTAVKAVKTEETTKDQRVIIESINSNFDNAQVLAKKAWFAYLGAVGRSVEEAQSRFSQVTDGISSRVEKISKERDELVADLVNRGEKVQDDAALRLKESRSNIEAQIETAKNRLTELSSVEATKSRMSELVSVINIPAKLQEMSDKLEDLSKDLKKTA